MPDRVPRRPLAFGMWEWGPLPGTTATIVWDGPGEPLMFTYPRRAIPIQHPTANGRYHTVKAADQAVQAFYAAYLAAEAEEEAREDRYADVIAAQILAAHDGDPERAGAWARDHL
jgi:hypothetical protein